LNEELKNTLSKVKEKADPWLDFNRRGQLLILIPLTIVVLLLRLILFLFSDYGVLVLNLVAFALVFFWVTRIVFTEVKMDKKIPINSSQKKIFIYISSACFFIMNFTLLVDEIIVSPLIIIVSGFFLVIWLFSLVLDRLILRDTFVHFYFKYLSVIVISIIIFNVIIALIIN
jgi:hypothetical protein